MNQLLICELFERHGFTKDESKILIGELVKNENLCTKADLKDLEIKFGEKIDQLTWRMLSGITVIMGLFKLLEKFTSP